MYLVDSNVFLEELLEQEKASTVNLFFESVEPEQVFISDLSLHSICIVLSGLKKYDLFSSFMNDLILNETKILSLDSSEILNLRYIMEKLKLDFDDSYQYFVAKKYNLQLISFDKDFDKTDLKRIEPSKILER